MSKWGRMFIKRLLCFPKERTSSRWNDKRASKHTALCQPTKKSRITTYLYKSRAVCGPWPMDGPLLHPSLLQPKEYRVWDVLWAWFIEQECWCRIRLYLDERDRTNVPTSENLHSCGLFQLRSCLWLFAHSVIEVWTMIFVFLVNWSHTSSQLRVPLTFLMVQADSTW